jgi:hypothetical protein
LVFKAWSGTLTRAASHSNLSSEIRLFLFGSDRTKDRDITG